MVGSRLSNQFRYISEPSNKDSGLNQSVLEGSPAAFECTRQGLLGGIMYCN